ncbi:MAG: DegV family protein [Methanomassiliicoccales archaeon]
MNKIALLTDSACDLPASIIEQYNIQVLPLKIIYGQEVFADRVEIQPDEVYARMPQQIPTTTLPSVQEIHDMFVKLQDQGYEKVLAIHISSGLSGTFAAVKMVADDFTDLEIKVVDTKTLSMGQGFQVYEAARDIAAGLPWAKICANLTGRGAKIEVFYVLETLEYLKRGGRIGKVAAAFGGILRIKPIISVDPEGKYFIFARTRGREQSIRKLGEIIENIASNNRIKLAVMHGGAEIEALKLKTKLAGLTNVIEVLFGQISPALGVHTGPGLIGVCYMFAE